jgi:hypothetical protein
MTPEELVESACPILGELGGAFYFTPETMAHGRQIGLDGFRFYIEGRGGVLGDVEAPVIVGALGYFEPKLVTRMWDTARAIVPPREAARAYVEQSRQFGRDHFAALSGLEYFCAAAEGVRGALHPAGLGLYPGLSAEPLADDVPGRAMQLVAELRELRGSVHLLAVVASRVEPRVAHYVRRPDTFTQFGWSEDDVPVVTEEVLTRLAEADGLTDRLMADAFGVLDEAGRSALLGGARRMRDAVA